MPSAISSTNIAPPDLAQLLAPFLPALPPATISTDPAIGILPLLSPILRQRVNILSSGSNEPWLRLLCYDTEKAAKLADIARSGNLEPHPVSGEVEVDWDYDAETRFRRIDEETLQALVALAELGLVFQLVYCINDPEGGGDGWRVGEVTVADKPSPFSNFGGVSSVAEADRQFHDVRAKNAPPKANGTTNGQSLTVDQGGGAPVHHADEDDEDDDGYWARYDATPSRTPAQKHSPAPHSMANSHVGDVRTSSAEDDYFRQYDDVQPAMDNHDPDEAEAAAAIAPPLGLSRVVNARETTGSTTNGTEASEVNETQGTWTLAELDKTDSNNEDEEERLAALVHPRPASSASSNGSHTVAKLEQTAEKQGQNEFGVKQHISRSIRSLFMLSRASGIDREEFERLVHDELDILGIVEANH